MKTEKKILTAFLLNSSFSLIEFIGGIFTGSIAILSDAVHDAGDAVSIGLSYFLERKSTKNPDESYTYGYRRYSVLGAAITDGILLVGSFAVIAKGIERIINPAEINSGGMIIFAVFGFVMNLLAAFFTRGGESLNQKAVNLHMLEDVLGWAVVLVGSVVIRLTGLYIIDPIMSISVALFILVNAVRGFRQIGQLFLEKTPEGIDIKEIKEHLLTIEGVKDIHHIHIRSLDGEVCYATLHAVVIGDTAKVKHSIKEELKEHGISHSTVETESEGEECGERECVAEALHSHHGHHHHHHH